jgi:DNA-binding NtrC family response regulator
MDVLLADDERSIAVTLRDDLEEAGHTVTVVDDGLKALKEAQAHRFDVVITDIRMPGMDGLSLLKEIKSEEPSPEVIVITGHATIDTAVEAIRRGALEYVRKPFRNDEIVRIIETLGKVKSLENKVQTLTSQLGEDRARALLVGESVAMRRVVDLVRTISDSHEDVLIEGETGTGKELVAKMVWEMSPRRDGPFVVLSCSAFPQTLLEDEIFGHEKGAFTDARTRKIGRFERANGGVLFLDDIDDMPVETQVKLLRVLQERSMERLGGEKTITLDVRVVVATKISLKSAVEDGEFREDLFHRINIIPIRLPPLRERVGDVPLLVDHFIARHAKGRTYRVDEVTLGKLVDHTWPGNVRELENGIRRAIAMSGGKELLDPDHLVVAAPHAHREGTEPAEGPVERALREVVREAEAHHIKRVLKHTNNHRANTAKILGISRKNLWEKMRELEIRDQET